MKKKPNFNSKSRALEIYSLRRGFSLEYQLQSDCRIQIVEKGNIL